MFFILPGISYIVLPGASAPSVYFEDSCLGDLSFPTQLWTEQTLARIPDVLWGARSMAKSASVRAPGPASRAWGDPRSAPS
jgi:hypothetical protein